LQITYSLPASAEVLSGHIVAQAYVWGSHVVASNYTQTAWDQSGDFSRGMVLAEASSQVASNEFTMELNISPTPELGLVHAAGVRKHLELFCFFLPSLHPTFASYCS